MQTDNPDPSDFEENKEQKIERIISELEAINYQGSDSETFDYSNDMGIAELIPQINLASKEISGEIRTALIIGSGPLWNIPKSLNNIDFIISLDINKKQLERNISRKQEILAAEQVQDLLPIPNHNIDNDDIIAQIQERRALEAPAIEIKSYGNYHYLSSNEELKRTKEYLKRARIAYVCGNIADNTFTTQLGNILNTNKANIIFADLTNTSEWICGSKIDFTKRDNFINSLRQLPIDIRCPILHSRSIGRIGRSPICSKLNLGLKSYGESLI